MILPQPVILNPVFFKTHLYSETQGEGSYSELF